MGGACNTYGEKRCVYKVFVGRTEERIQLGRDRCRWNDNIKMDLQDVVCGVGGALIELIWLKIGTLGGCCE
jgi:hypothetical protein